MKNKNIALLVPLLVVATVLAASFTFGTPTAHGAPLSVLTVDCTPLVSPGGSSFGAQNTMGMALQSVDIGGDFIVTEDTPAAFRARAAASLASFDLIAINNHPTRLGDGCVQGAGTGLGATWQGVIGINNGGRVLLTSHDAPRFHMNAPAGSLFFGGGSPGPGVEPFGAPDLVRQAALWAGGGSNTGLLIFNDSPGFAGGVGWDNAELNLPAAWSITDLPQIFGIGDGGYTDILPAFAGHPVYAGLSDGRFAVNTISSFSANIGDGSFDSIFGSFNAGIFTVTEAVINAGIIDVGGFGVGSGTAAPGPDGSAITLIRDELKEPTSTPTITPTPKPPVDPPFVSETLAAGTGIKIEKTVHVPSFAPLVDVVFAMDLTGSMGGALTNLKAEIATIIADLEAAAGPADLEIGIVSFMDYNGSFDSNPACGYNTSYGSGLDTPFRVDKPVTDDFVAVQAEVAGWVLGFGEDGPEDYGRIVWEAAQPDSGIGYRAGAQKILVMFGDNIPHDCDLSAGGPAPDFGSVTGINPGRNNVIDFGGDDIDWQDDAIPAAQAAGVKLLVVNNGLNVAFWDFWSQETGGDAEEINPDGTVPGGLDLSDVILGLIRGVTVNSVTAEAVGCDPL
ncbi:MAG: hypothetical protein J4N98_06700, partial [Chloroflexi bacterium]|nr:hypothetical protein [Chloroflexota bacterium]